MQYMHALFYHKHSSRNSAYLQAVAEGTYAGGRLIHLCDPAAHFLHTHRKKAKKGRIIYDNDNDDDNNGYITTL